MTLLIALSFGFWFPGVGLYCAWREKPMVDWSGPLTRPPSFVGEVRRLLADAFDAALWSGRIS